LAATGVNLAAKLILARLIAPADLGLYALALLVLLAGDMLVDLGMSQHLIREKHRPYGNLLLIRLGIAGVLFAGLELLSPTLRFWGNEFPAIIQVMAVTLVIKAASSVPNTYFDRELLIQRSLIPQVARIATMGVVSIVLAYFGQGVWALVWGTVLAEIVFAGLIWNSAWGHMPLDLTWKHSKGLIWGSRYLFLIGVMGFALQQGDTAVLGALLTPQQVGFYTMALTLIILVSKVVESAVFRVIYPMFCEYSGDCEKLGRSYRLATLAVTGVEAPIYFFLLFNAPVIVPLALGKQWIPSALLMQALAVFGIINPFSTFGNEVLRARKRDSILTLSTVIGAITLLTTGYVLTSRYGVLGMVAAHYIIIGSIPTIVAVYRTVTSDFKRLAGQLLIVYATSLAVMGAVYGGFSSAPNSQALISFLLLPVCWIGYYRAFAGGAGRDVARTLLTRAEAAKSPQEAETSNEAPEERPLRVGILCPGYGRVVRGVETFTDELCRRLLGAKPEWRIDIYSSGDRMEGLPRGVRQVLVPSIRRDGGSASLYAKVGHRLGIFLRTRIDAECLSFTLALAPRLLFAKYDVVFNQAGPFAGKLLRLKRRLDGTPFIHKTASGYGELELIMAQQRPDAIVATSPYVKDWLDEALPGLRIECIPNAVDLGAFRPYSAQELEAARDGHAVFNVSRPRVLFVGAMDPMKRPELLISAVAKLPDVGLVMVGTGRIADRVAKLGAARLGSRFLHVPKVGREEMALYYSACDLFTLPSEEPFGIAFLEAMACNKPVLSHASPVQEWIFGEAGTMCDCTDPDEYAAAIGSALAADFGDRPLERSRMFDWSAVAPRYAELFSRVVSSRRAP